MTGASLKLCLQCLSGCLSNSHRVCIGDVSHKIVRQPYSYEIDPKLWKQYTLQTLHIETDLDYCEKEVVCCPPTANVQYHCSWDALPLGDPMRRSAIWQHVAGPIRSEARQLRYFIKLVLEILKEFSASPCRALPRLSTQRAAQQTGSSEEADLWPFFPRGAQGARRHRRRKGPARRRERRRLRSVRGPDSASGRRTEPTRGGDRAKGALALA